MKRTTTSTNTDFKFTVGKNQVNRHQALLPFVLYDKMVSSATKSVTPFQYKVHPTHNSFKLNVLKNAHLNDQLVIKKQVHKLNSKELQLSISVLKQHPKKQEIICKALFGFSIKENQGLQQAS